MFHRKWHMTQADWEAWWAGWNTTEAGRRLHRMSVLQNHLMLIRSNCDNMFRDLPFKEFAGTEEEMRAELKALLK